MLLCTCVFVCVSVCNFFMRLIMRPCVGVNVDVDVDTAFCFVIVVKKLLTVNRKMKQAKTCRLSAPISPSLSLPFSLSASLAVKFILAQQQQLMVSLLLLLLFGFAAVVCIRVAADGGRSAAELEQWNSLICNVQISQFFEHCLLLTLKLLVNTLTHTHKRCLFFSYFPFTCDDLPVFFAAFCHCAK